jgi:hypothetical protein
MEPLCLTARMKNLKAATLAGRSALSVLTPYQHMLKGLLCLVLMLVGIYARTTSAAVIEVPANYATIQGAINAASGGDEIIVSPGTYVENINFGGKNVILRSTDPASPTVVASTVIDGNGSDSVVTFSGSELTSCVLAGFTLTRGTARYGGGINGNGTLATIEYNEITYNRAYYSVYNETGMGGGVYCCNGIIQNNTISDNWAFDAGGGLGKCDGVIKHNVIVANDGFLYGGGLYWCKGTIEDNIIRQNSSYYGAGVCYCKGIIKHNSIYLNSAGYGGGVWLCDAAVMSNYIFANSATSDGGGLDNCDGTIENNFIHGNVTLYGKGGGLMQCSGTIQNNMIWGNRAAWNGGGLAGCRGIIQNNTIYGNSAGDYGGGLDCCKGIIRNCIIWQNTAREAAQLYNCVTPSYSCIRDWTGGGTGNILLDPVLADPTNGEFHLLPDSPCIDAGCLIAELVQDFEGDPRGIGGTSEARGDGSDYDIGADEFTGTIPTPSPTPTPTATPRPTGSPSPTPLTPPVVNYDFLTGDQGWTSQTVPVVFVEPSFARIAGFLQIISNDNTNTFGYWQSPSDSVPVSTNYLYRARFRVVSDQTYEFRVPQIRLRVNSSNLQQADYLAIESRNEAGASPTRLGAWYDLYFVTPSNDSFCMLAFELLNYDPEDATQATLSLDTVWVDRLSLDSLSTASLVRLFDFATSQDGWAQNAFPYVFSPPDFVCEAGALEMRSTTNTNTFGYWTSNSDDITIAGNLLYRGTFEVRTDVTSKSAVPQMRLRFNTGNLQASRTLGIESVGDGANSPGILNTVYDKLYFLPPANCVGENLIVSFDMLNFDPSDAATGSLILDRVAIETLEPPGTP